MKLEFTYLMEGEGGGRLEKVKDVGAHSNKNERHGV
jgi:hypothetical protein